MAIDLTLIALPGKGEFVLQKAFDNHHYANDLDKIQQPEVLKRHLEMVRKNPDESPENVIEELISDSEEILNLYPVRSPGKYSFYSVNRGYDTLNYLLTEFLKEEQNELLLKYALRSKFLYNGQDISKNHYHVCFQFFDRQQTSEIYDILKATDFKKMMKHYDANKMTEVYKLTSLTNINVLEEEYNELKEFYRQAVLIDGFVLIKLD